METFLLNNGVKIPCVGIGTYLLNPAERRLLWDTGLLILYY